MRVFLGLPGPGLIKKNWECSTGFWNIAENKFCGKQTFIIQYVHFISEKEASQMYTSVSA